MSVPSWLVNSVWPSKLGKIQLVDSRLSLKFRRMWYSTNNTYNVVVPSYVAPSYVVPTTPERTSRTVLLLLPSLLSKVPVLEYPYSLSTHTVLGVALEGTNFEADSSGTNTSRSLRRGIVETTRGRYSVNVASQALPQLVFGNKQIEAVHCYWYLLHKATKTQRSKTVSRGLTMV